MGVGVGAGVGVLRSYVLVGYHNFCLEHSDSCASSFMHAMLSECAFFDNIIC